MSLSVMLKVVSSLVHRRAQRSPRGQPTRRQQQDDLVDPAQLALPFPHCLPLETAVGVPWAPRSAPARSRSAPSWPGPRCESYQILGRQGRALLATALPRRLRAGRSLRRCRVPDAHLLVAHLCAAAALALMAAHADTLLWSLVHLLAQAWIPSLVAVPVPVLGSTRPYYADLPQPRIRLDAYAPLRRGPPAS